MLNKLLYDALECLFKRVEIANEGVTASIRPDPAGTGAWQIEKGDEHGEQYRVNCPFCKDHKKHLYISYLSYAQPVMQGVPLRVGHLRAQCFRKGCLNNKENRHYLEGQIGRAMALVGDGMQNCYILNCDEQEDEEPKLKVSHEPTVEGLRTWVEDWQPISEHTDPVVLDYLASRRVTMEDVNWLGIGWGPIKSTRTGEYINGGKPWVIFPIVNNGKLLGVQARCPAAYLKEGGIKYWFHPGCRKRTVLLNLDIARKLGVGVICEGAFDVLSVGKPGICCFGHTPSVAQQRILSGFDHGLIWLPDTDVKPNLNTIEIAQKMVNSWNADNRFDKGAHVVVLPEKDAGDMTRQEVWETIISQVTPEMQQYLLDKVIPVL